MDAASLIRMDALEGHPDWYFRLPMKIKLLAEEDSEQVVVVAEIYLNRKFKKFGMDVDAVVVSTGDFRDADTLEKQQALRQQQQQEVEQQEQQQLSVSSDASPEQISLHRSFAFLDLIESSEGTLEELPSQFDDPFRSTPHQCSWFAIGAVARAAAFREAWKCRDVDAALFRQQWSDLLKDATRLRKETDPDHAEIQTLCSPVILSHFNLTLGDTIRHVTIHPEMEDLCEAHRLASFTNAAEIKQTKLDFLEGTWEGLLVELHTAAAASTCVVAHRRGKAFAALPVMSRLEGGKEDGKNDDPTSLPPRALFLVMDSHIRQVGVMTAENLVAYITCRSIRWRIQAMVS